MSKIDELREWCERAIATAHTDPEDREAVAAMDIAWQEFTDRADPETVIVLIDAARAAVAFRAHHADANGRPTRGAGCRHDLAILEVAAEVEALG